MNAQAKGGFSSELRREVELGVWCISVVLAFQRH